jgi:hypothetical protein
VGLAEAVVLKNAHLGNSCGEEFAEHFVPLFGEGVEGLLVEVHRPPHSLVRGGGAEAQHLLSFADVHGPGHDSGVAVKGFVRVLSVSCMNLTIFYPCQVLNPRPLSFVPCNKHSELTHFRV